MRPRLGRLLVDQVEDHREVVDAERPERVLVLADLAEVLAVAVDAEHVAELARVDELLQLADARVVEQQVAGHQHEVALLGERDELVHLGAAHRRRLLDEDVLARLERLLRERVVRRHRRRDDDRLELGVGEQLVERAGRRARWGSAARTARAAPPRRRRSSARSASSSTLRTRFAPQAPRPDLADADGSLRASTPCPRPRGRAVALRKSTTTFARAHDVGVVDRRVRGDDRDAVVGLGLERRRGHPVELGHVRVVVGDVGARVPQQLRSASRPASRACRRCRPCTRRRGSGSSSPETERCSPWFSACEMTERQKYGMLLLTSPASSMKRVEKSYSRAFQER